MINLRKPQHFGIAGAMLYGQVLDTLIQIEQHFPRIVFPYQRFNPEKAAYPLPARHFGDPVDAGRRI